MIENGRAEEAGGAIPPCKNKDDELSGLKKVWANLDEGYLRTYLTAGPQNPTINLASVIARHNVIRLIDECNPGSGVWRDSMILRANEIKFAQHAINRLSIILQGTGLPKFLARVKRKYTKILGDRDQTNVRDSWRRFCERLHSMNLRRPSVLECACGSANDYRTLEDYGIARLINYVGMDITDKNISNAKSLYPSIDFRVGDASNTGFGDSQFDCIIVFDLFEHLSLSLMQDVLTELIRVAKRELILTFFNMEEIPSHIANPHPVKSYHWNTLSKREMMSYISQNRKVIGVEALSLFVVNPVEFEFSGGKNSNNWIWTLYLSP